MAERDDTGVAEHKVEREREQDPDHDLGADAQAAFGHEEKSDSDAPRQDMAERRPELARRRGGGCRGCGRDWRCCHYATDFAGMRPCGRHSSRMNTATYSM